MRQNAFHLCALTAAVVAVTAVLGASTAGAAVADSQRASSSVTSYLSVWYNTQSCDSALRYQLVNMEMRWYRDTSARRVPNAEFNFGQLGYMCSGQSAADSYGTSTEYPCFGCGGSTTPAWTPSYTRYSYDWPYVGKPSSNPLGIPIYVGAWVKSWVTDQSGNQTGYICNQIYFIDNGPCS